MNARMQYLEAVSKEYSRADEKGRGRLLDEAGKRTGLNRKYLIRVLNQPTAGRSRKARKRRAEYGSEVTALKYDSSDGVAEPKTTTAFAILARITATSRA